MLIEKITTKVGQMKSIRKMVLVQYPSADSALAHSITLMLPFVRFHTLHFLISIISIGVVIFFTITSMIIYILPLLLITTMT